MAERKQVVRDLVVKLGAKVEAQAEKVIKGFGAALKNLGRGIKVMAVDLALYNAALMVANARLGDRALAGNLARVRSLIVTVATGTDLATRAYERFSAGLGLINQQLVEQARHVVKNSELLRMSTRDYQSVAYAFQRFGLTEEDMTQALLRFGDAAGTALDRLRGPVSQARIEFQKLGITVDELTGRNPLEVMELVAEKFANAPDRQKALKAVYHLLGEELGSGFNDGLAKHLTPALAQGAAGITSIRRQALNQGLLIDDKLLRNGAQLADQFATLQRMIETFWQSVGLRLAPAVGVLVKLWQDLIVANRQWIEQRVQQVADLLTAALVKLDTVIRNVDWEALFAVWGAQGLLKQAVGITLGFLAKLYLLAQAFLILKALLPALMTPFGLLVVQLDRFAPALMASARAWYAWAAGAAAAAASASAFELTGAAILAFVGTMYGLAAVIGAVLIVAIPLAIVIEDFFTFLKGGKSVLGDTIAYLSELIPWMKELGPTSSAGWRVVLSLMNFLLAVTRELAQGFLRSLVPAIQRFAIALALLLGFEDVAEMLRTWSGGLDEFATFIDGVTASISRLDEAVSAALRPMATFLEYFFPLAVAAGPGLLTPSGMANTVGSAAMGGTVAMATGLTTNTATVHQNITINGSSGSPSAVGAEAYRGAREALEGSVR